MRNIFLFTLPSSFRCFARFVHVCTRVCVCGWVCVRTWYVCVCASLLDIRRRGKLRKFSNSSPETILLSLPFCLIASHLSNGATGYDAISDMLKKGGFVYNRDVCETIA